MSHESEQLAKVNFNLEKIQKQNNQIINLLEQIRKEILGGL